MDATTPPDEEYKQLRQDLMRQAAEQGLTHPAWARRAGVCSETVYRFRAGKKKLKPASIKKLAAALKTMGNERQASNAAGDLLIPLKTFEPGMNAIRVDVIVTDQDSVRLSIITDSSIHFEATLSRELGVQVGFIFGRVFESDLKPRLLKLWKMA